MSYIEQLMRYDKRNQEVRMLRAQGVKVIEIAKRLKITRTRVYQILKRAAS